VLIAIEAANKAEVESLVNKAVEAGTAIYNTPTRSWLNVPA
jgi:predicted lactoylglutathione lyase